ncbi:MAG: flagellar basal body P-ring formation protein FlgA [Spirochaetes bacterium]|nr:flagellar basal body P-ring formation protein FlgA [Spirochaetota bacterium]
MRTFWMLVIAAVCLSGYDFNLKGRAVLSTGEVRLHDIVDGAADAPNPVLFTAPVEPTVYQLRSLIAHLNRVIPDVSYSISGSSIMVIPSGAASAAIPAGAAASVRTPVISAANDASADKVKKTITDKLLDAVIKPGENRDDIRIKFLYKLPEASIDNTDQVKFIFAEGKQSGTQRIRVELYAADGRKKNWFEILVEIYRVKQVLTAKDYIGKNVRVAEGMVAFEEYRTDRIPADSITSLAELSGTTTKYYVKRGNILRRFHLGETVAIKKGDIVDVHYQDGRIAMIVKATALASGTENDTISLRNETTKREFTGSITGGVVYYKH